METAKIVLLALALAFLSESMVEYLFGTLMKKVPMLTSWSWVLMYVSLAVGVWLAFAYRLDLLALIQEDTQTVQGIILSGAAIGRGANFVHDFVSKYLLKVS